MKARTTAGRRDFLRLALRTGGAVALAPFLKACGNLETPTPSPTATLLPTALPTAAPTATADDLLGGLRGLGIDSFFQEAYRRWMLRDPEGLTTLGLADAYGAGDGKLTDISDAFVRQTQALEKGTLELLRGYDRSAFSEAQAVTADIYEWFLDDLVRGHPFMYDDYPINPVVTSIHFLLYSLFTIYQPLNNAEDANDYIARLSQVGSKLSQLIDGLKRREERGVILPSFLLRWVRGEIDALGRASPASHDYFTSFSGRLKGVSEEERATLSAQVQDEIKATVIPAYKSLSDCLSAQQAKAPDTVGVWQFSDGEAYYAQCLRRHTTTEMTADQIHELGKENVERVQGEMRDLFAALGYPSGESIPDLYARLTADSGTYSGEAAVKAYEDVISSVETVLPQAFETLPRARVEVIGGEQGDFYQPASFDGSRPGLFFARTNWNNPRFGVKTLAYHETIPGHHLQLALAQEVPDLPDLRRGMQFNAYTEGWALYAERLMSELGVYEDDPQGDLGRLQMEAFRAARLVVDTGIHAKRWSFDEAVDYMVQAAGFTPGYAQDQISRYSVWPGQATSYYLGFLKLVELRQKVKDGLGNKHDLKAFHELVLANGSVPLEVLERLIEAYIAANA